MKNKLTKFLLLFLALILAGPICPAMATNSQPFSVAVSILPQAFFVKRIGGHRVRVLVMVPPGGNPATYEPKPRQMASLSKCKLYFTIGVPFESAWLSRFLSAHPRILIRPVYTGIERVPMESTAYQPFTVKKSAMDPHIWLSPPLAILQARNVLEGLLQIDPNYKEMYEANFRKLASNIVDLDLKIRDLFANADGKNRFMVYHPAWGYFARTYGLRQIAIEREGKKPRPKDLQSLIQFAKESGFKHLFVQPQVSTQVPQVIAKAIGAQIIILDPLAPDWDQNLLRAAKNIKKALR